MIQPIQTMVFITAVGFVVASLLTPLSARFAIARGWLDHPDHGRKTHASPVPAVGGVAVFAAFVVALAQLPLVGEPAHWSGVGFFAMAVPLIVASLAVMLVGVVDDVRGARPRTKLAVQMAAAVFLFASGFRVERLSNPFGAAFELGYWALPVTVLWLVGMSNAFNLIDGMDGLAAGLALVSTTGLLTAAAFNGRIETALVAAALAGALLGFLPYNFNPARVFLGDCGALPVGFILAAIAVKSSIKASAAIAVAVPLLALALPILDVGLALVRRFVRRRPVLQGDRHHIHHRLVDLGLTPRRAVVTLYAVAALFTALALATAMGPRNVVWAVLALAVLAVAAGVRALGYWEVTEVQRSFLTRLTAGLRPSGDAALRGLEYDIGNEDDIRSAWKRLRATAWGIGFSEIHLVPSEAEAQRLPELHDSAPHERFPEDLGPERTATWSFELEVRGEVVAQMVVRRPLGRLDFDPLRLVSLIEGLVERHLARVEARDSAALAGTVSASSTRGVERELPGPLGERAPANPFGSASSR